MTLTAGVNWTAKSNNDWISITSGTSGTGSKTIAFTVGANPSVYERTGTMTIAGKTVTVKQEGLASAVSYDEEAVYGTDGGSGNVSVMTEAGGTWTAKSDVDWISVALGASGAGNGSVTYVVAPYNVTTASRTGTLTIAGKKVYVTQRGYEMSIDPYVAQIGSNSGDSLVTVAAPVGAIWNAVSLSPWITLTGGQSGTGSGTLTYTVQDNLTGGVRTGTILIAGEVYRVTQACSLPVSVTVAGHGQVNGGGAYDSGTEATLTAVPDEGYRFVQWTGDWVGNDNPATFTVDDEKNITAVFTPLPPQNISCTTNDIDKIGISWAPLAWATSYKVYRSTTNSRPSGAMITIDSQNCLFNDTSATPGVAYFYWVEAIGPEDRTIGTAVNGVRKLALSSISVVDGIAVLYAGESYPFKCMATYNDGTSNRVTANWTVTAGGAYAEIEAATGNLTVSSECDTEHIVTVEVSYTEDGISKTATADITVKSSVTTAVALANTEQTFSAGDVAWVGQRDVVHTLEGASLRTGVLSPGEKCELFIQVTGPGTLAFWWKTTGNGVFSARANGTVVGTSSATDWQQVTVEFLTNMTYSLVWEYVQGAAAYKTNDFGWLAEVIWTPAPAATRIIFNANGGECDTGTRDYATGAAYGEFPASTWTGHTFLGWFSSAEGGNKISENGYVPFVQQTFWAQWKTNTYAFRFNANGGLGTAMPNQFFAYGESKSLAACAYSRTGYTFAGWKRAGTDDTFADGATVSNLTSGDNEEIELVAQWDIIDYPIPISARRIAQMRIPRRIRSRMRLRSARSRIRPGGCSSVGRLRRLLSVRRATSPSRRSGNRSSTAWISTARSTELVCTVRRLRPILLRI